MRKAGPVGFDLDLTLINSRPAIMAAWSAVAAELGVLIDLAEVDQRMGIKLEDEVSYWFPADGHQAAADSYRRHYVRLAPTLTFPLPGAAEALAAVRRAGERAVIVTAKHPVSVQPSLDAVGLQADEVFTHVHGPEKAAVLARLGAAVYVGDTPADMAAGQSAGALRSAFRQDRSLPTELRAAGAEVVLGVAGTTSRRGTQASAGDLTGARGRWATDILALADRLWRGEARPASSTRSAISAALTEICDGVAFVPAFANVTAIRTADGLVLVDTGSAFAAAADPRRAAALDRAAAAHGYLLARAHRPCLRRRRRGRRRRPSEAGRRPVVIAHEALPPALRPVPADGRVQRGHQPAAVRHPRPALADRVPLPGPHVLRRADGRRRRHDARAAAREGRDRRPHRHLAGRPPGAVLRRPVHLGVAERRATRRRCSATRWNGRRRCAGCSRCEPEYLLPGHGLPVVGADRVAPRPDRHRRAARALVSQTLEVMNGGGRLDEAIHTVAVPRHLADRPYLQPVYDEPEFIVRTVWRQYGGWWDGNPATLKPAPERALAAETRGAGGRAGCARRPRARAGRGRRSRWPRNAGRGQRWARR